MARFPLLISELFIKKEVTFGTDAVVTGSNVVRVIEPEWTPIVNMQPQDYNSSSFDPFPEIPGFNHATIAFKTILTGAAAAAASPRWSEAFEACGVLEAVAANVQFSPLTQGIPSVTISFERKDSATTSKRVVLVGCRGTAKIIGEVGGRVVVEWEFTGGLTTQTDETPIGALSFDDTQPIAFQGSTFTVGGVVLNPKTFEFDLGNSVQPLFDASKSNGIIGGIIDSKDPTLQIDPIDTAVAFYDYHGKMIAGTLEAGQIIYGSSGGRQHTFDFPKLQIRSVAPGSREGHAVPTIIYSPKRNAAAADDFFNLTQD
jgi:hypothetical protein